MAALNVAAMEVMTTTIRPRACRPSSSRHHPAGIGDADDVRAKTASKELSGNSSAAASIL